MLPLARHSSAEAVKIAEEENMGEPLRDSRSSRRIYSTTTTSSGSGSSLSPEGQKVLRKTNGNRKASSASSMPTVRPTNEREEQQTRMRKVSSLPPTNGMRQSRSNRTIDETTSGQSSVVSSVASSITADSKSSGSVFGFMRRPFRSGRKSSDPQRHHQQGETQNFPTIPEADETSNSTGVIGQDASSKTKRCVVEIDPQMALTAPLAIRMFRTIDEPSPWGDHPLERKREETRTQEPRPRTPTQEPRSRTPTQEPRPKSPTREPRSKTPTRELRSRTPTRELRSKAPTKEPRSRTPISLSFWRRNGSHDPFHAGSNEAPHLSASMEEKRVKGRSTAAERPTNTDFLDLPSTAEEHMNTRLRSHRPLRAMPSQSRSDRDGSNEWERNQSPTRQGKDRQKSSTFAVVMASENREGGRPRSRSPTPNAPVERNREMERQRSKTPTPDTPLERNDRQRNGNTASSAWSGRRQKDDWPKNNSHVSGYSDERGEKREKDRRRNVPGEKERDNRQTCERRQRSGTPTGELSDSRRQDGYYNAPAVDEKRMEDRQRLQASHSAQMHIEERSSTSTATSPMAVPDSWFAENAEADRHAREYMHMESDKSAPPVENVVLANAQKVKDDFPRNGVLSSDDGKAPAPSRWQYQVERDGEAHRGSDYDAIVTRRIGERRANDVATFQLRSAGDTVPAGTQTSSTNVPAPNINAVVSPPTEEKKVEDDTPLAVESQQRQSIPATEPAQHIPVVRSSTTSPPPANFVVGPKRQISPPVKATYPDLMYSTSERPPLGVGNNQNPEKSFGDSPFDPMPSQPLFRVRNDPPVKEIMPNSFEELDGSVITESEISFALNSVQRSQRSNEDRRQNQPSRFNSTPLLQQQYSNYSPHLQQQQLQRHQQQPLPPRGQWQENPQQDQYEKRPFHHEQHRRPEVYGTNGMRQMDHIGNAVVGSHARDLINQKKAKAEMTIGVIQEMIENQEEREQELEDRRQRLVSEAKNKLDSGNKRGAIRNMKKAKLLAQEQDKISDAIDTMEGQVMSIQSSINSGIVFKVISQGSEAARNLSNDVAADDPNRLFDDIKEGLDYATEVQKILAQPAENVDLDDESLLSELMNEHGAGAVSKSRLKASSPGKGSPTGALVPINEARSRSRSPAMMGRSQSPAVGTPQPPPVMGRSRTPVRHYV